MTDKLRLSRLRPPGGRTCGYHFGCDKKPTRHFIWLNTMSVSNACDEHAAYIYGKDNTNNPYDEHAFGHDCDMPGAAWHFPYADEKEGYCFFPAPDDTSLLMEEELVAAS